MRRGNEKCIELSRSENEGKRLHVRSCYRWNDNIKFNFKEIGNEHVYDLDLTKCGYCPDAAPVSMVTKLQFPYRAQKLLVR